MKGKGAPFRMSSLTTDGGDQRAEPGEVTPNAALGSPPSSFWPGSEMGVGRWG